MSKHVGARYDSSLRESEHGRSIYNMWRKVRRGTHCDEWEDFPTFYTWAMQSGFEIGMWLRKIDKNAPYNPSNCVLYTVGECEARVHPAWANEWNKTVNRIRKYYGMPPLEETKYGD